MPTLKNQWWKGGPGEIAKGLALRFLFAFVNLLRTLREHIVYLTLLLGIACLFLSAFLYTWAEESEQEVLEPLREIDTAVDDLVNGINFMTQEVPKEATLWLNKTLQTTEEKMDETLTNVIQGLTEPVNFIARTTEESVNSLIIWARSRVPAQNGQAPQTLVTVPQLFIPIPDITGWAPILQLLDLSVLQIPTREFSVEEELSPFVRDVFEVPEVIALYLSVMGSILVCYAGLRLLWAFFDPFVPRLNCNYVGNCVKCIKLCGQTAVDVSKELYKPWIHVPMIVGILMTLFVTLLLYTAIDEVETKIRIPLQETDKQILKLVGEVNNFTTEFPFILEEFLNKQQDFITSRAVLYLNLGISQVVGEVSQLFFSVENEINRVLGEIDIQINLVEEIDAVALGLKIPENFIPNIPRLNLDALILPADTIAFVEKAISPWVDDRIREFREVAFWLLFASVLLFALPTLKVLCVALYPWVPHSVVQFFKHPPWEENEKGEGKKTAESTDLVVGEPSLKA